MRVQQCVRFARYACSLSTIEQVIPQTLVATTSWDSLINYTRITFMRDYSFSLTVIHSSLVLQVHKVCVEKYLHPKEVRRL